MSLYSFIYILYKERKEDEEDMYSYYLDVIKKYKEKSDIDLPKLEEYLKALDKAYGEGKVTELSDEEYDRIHQIYNELSHKVIIGGMSSRTKVKHDYLDLKGTIRKVHYVTPEEKRKDPGAISAHKVLWDWIIDTRDKVRTKLHRDIYILGFWPKFDGISIILSFNEDGKLVKAITRGDEELGVDKTGFFANVDFSYMIPDKFKGKKIGIKTECIMPNDLFDEYNNKYAGGKLVNARTAITSLLNSETFTEIHRKYINLIPLMYSVDGKQVPPLPELVKTVTRTAGISYLWPGITFEKDTLIDIIKTSKKYADNIGYDCDGIVVRWVEPDVIEALGRDNDNFVNKFEIAYKFPKKNNYTKLVDIIQDIGLMGKVSFTAEVEPIKINGKIIKHASLGSEDKAKALNLAKGDMVNIKYEIVPYLCIDEYCEENRSGNKPIKIVDKCPYCGKELTRNPELGCYDNPDCPAKVQGKIYTFCTRMGLTDIGESMIETLYHHGILNSIKDLFYLNEKIEEILQIDGFGKKILKNLISQISKLKATESQVLSSVAIKGIGPKTAKNIISIYNINELYNIDINSLMEIPGISNNKATIIKKGVNDNKDLLEFILTHVKIVKASKKSKPDGTVVFTGFRNPKLEKFLLEHFNLEVRDSLTKDVTIVLALDKNAKSSKLEKARKYNIPIYDLHEACEKFGYIE